MATSTSTWDKLQKSGLFAERMKAQMTKTCASADCNRTSSQSILVDGFCQYCETRNAHIKEDEAENQKHYADSGVGDFA